MRRLPTLAHDKANHWAYGSLVTAAVLVVSNPIAAFVALLAVAVGKEIYDRVSKTGTADVMDTLATVAGGLVVLAPTVLSRL